VEPGSGPVGELVAVARPGAGLADPAGIGLRWDDVAQVLEAVEHVHGAVLDAVLVAADEAPADAAVVDPLAAVVELARAGVQALDHLLHLAAVVAQPDGPGEHEDVRGEDLLVDRWP